MHLSLTKPVSDHGRVWHCSVLKQIFKTIASLKDSSLTPLLHGMLSYFEPHLLKTLTILPPRQLWMPEWSMVKVMLLPRLPLLHASTLHQVRLHRQMTTTILLLQLLLMRTSRCSMSSNLFGHYWQKGEKRMSWQSSNGFIWAVALYFALCLQILPLTHFVLWVVTLKLDGRLLLICHFVMRW